MYKPISICPLHLDAQGSIIVSYLNIVQEKMNKTKTQKKIKQNKNIYTYIRAHK